MTQQMQTVSGRYGAPLGRASHGTLENVEPRTLRLFKVRLDRGGYDDGGAYWGHGAPIWCATDGAGFFQTVRAGSRERAAIDLEIAPDYLDRLARPIDRHALATYALGTIDGCAPRWEGWTNAAACDILRACGAKIGFGAHSREELEAIASAPDAFTAAYIQAVYFTDTGDLEQPKSEAPLSVEARAAIRRECREWQEKNAALLAEAYARDGYTAERAGHDFWLTRNGHGAGFWDRAELDDGELGDRLSEAARAAGERHAYETGTGEVGIE